MGICVKEYSPKPIINNVSKKTINLFFILNCIILDNIIHL